MKESLTCFLLVCSLAVATHGWGGIEQNAFPLPQPSYDGRISVESAIKSRRTTRSFRPTALTIVQFSQLLWSAQGITDERQGLRSAPSAGALYPLDVYAVVGDDGVEGLEAGVYHYQSENHSVRLIVKGDRRREVASASLWQMWMAKASVMFIMTSEYKRITRKYGKRGMRYAQIEVGHVGQNIFLQSEALGLKAGIVGAFHDDAVAKAIGAPEPHRPLIIMPVGYEK